MGHAPSASVAELEPDLRVRLAVHERDDARPGLFLRVVVEPGATRGDPRVARHARHLGHQEPRAAHRAAPVVDEMEFARHAFICRVHAHGRHDDTVRDLHPTQTKRRKNRRNGRVVRNLSRADRSDGESVDASERGRFGRWSATRRIDGCRERSSHVRDERRVAHREVFVANLFAAGKKPERERERIEREVPLRVLEKEQAVLRGGLGLFDDHATLFFVPSQGSRDVLVGRHSCNLVREGDGVLHRELRAGPDAEVSGVHRVAGQNHVLVAPRAAAQRLKVEPCRAVGHEPVPTEVLREELLQERDLRVFGHVREARALEGFFVRLDDERARVAVESVRVNLEEAPFVLLEEERKGLERLLRTEPHVLRPTAL